MERRERLVHPRSSGQSALASPIHKGSHPLLEIGGKRSPPLLLDYAERFFIPVEVDAAVAVPSTEPEFDPLLLNIPLQLLAYHVALKKNCDIDHPRNLAKSVTVE